MMGHQVGKNMGVNIGAAFAGSEDQAIVDGNFAVLVSELQGVLKTLHGAGIDVVAIHNHMTGETPRIVFLHSWGIGGTEALAKGIKAALETEEKPWQINSGSRRLARLRDPRSSRPAVGRPADEIALNDAS